MCVPEHSENVPVVYYRSIHLHCMLYERSALSAESVDRPGMAANLGRG